MMEQKEYKLTKELLDSVRDIDGFPVGSDEDILALSDLPYYTAGPNPFIEDFIKQYGKPYDSETDSYHREPFAFDVSEGKNDPIYNAHSYHTKVPHKAIMRYILHYTEPGDIIFDGFCGTGMTGVAAQLCETADIKLKNELFIDYEKKSWGKRYAVLNELSPAASFIAHNLTKPIDISTLKKDIKRLLKEVEQELGWVYDTNHIIDLSLNWGFWL